MYCATSLIQPNLWHTPQPPQGAPAGRGCILKLKHSATALGLLQCDAPAGRYMSDQPLRVKIADIDSWGPLLTR